MPLSSYAILKEKMPLLQQGWSRVILFLPPLMSFVFAITVFWMVDPVLIELFEQTTTCSWLSLYVPVLTQISVLLMAYYILLQLWVKESKYLYKYGEKGYQRAILLFYLPGITLLVSTLLHLFTMRGRLLLDKSPWGVLLGLYCLTIGIPLLSRSLLQFGVDHMFVVYLYYPDESRIVDQKLYSIIRHPAYSGLIHVAFGVAFFAGTINAFLALLFFLGCEHLWLRFVEEKELIERFGKDYEEYRKNVPAFLPRPRNFVRWLKLIWLGGHE